MIRNKKGDGEIILPVLENLITVGAPLAHALKVLCGTPLGINLGSTLEALLKSEVIRS